MYSLIAPTPREKLIAAACPVMQVRVRRRGLIFLFVVVAVIFSTFAWHYSTLFLPSIPIEQQHLDSTETYVLFNTLSVPDLEAQTTSTPSSRILPEPTLQPPATGPPRDPFAPRNWLNGPPADSFRGVYIFAVSILSEHSLYFFQTI